MTGHCDIVSFLGDERLSEIGVSAPLVTVVVTNFNYARFLQCCLESIAKQTYRNFRCVVVDDCSTDNSVEVVNAFISSPLSDGRFFLVRHETNQGQMSGFRTGLHNAEGPFLVYVDADDLLLPDFLESHLRVHSSYEPVAFTSSDQYQINDKGEVIGGTHSDHKAKGCYRYVLSQPLRQPYWVWATTSSMMFRRAVLELILPEEDGNYRICADNYMCHFANLIGNSLLIPAVHGCYRRHGSNHFSSNKIVGGAHPTGDMKQHPKDHIIRLNIFFVLCKRHELFTRILDDGLALRLASVAGPFEILRYRKLLPKSISVRKLVLLSLFLHLSQIIKMRLILNDKVRHDFQYGAKATVLKIPGR